MSVLIDLPEDLFIEILQEWLQTEQFRFLDSACCNKVIRCQLLKQLKAISVTSAVYNLHFFDWIYSREIKLKNLVLHDDCFEESNPKFKVRYENIQTIHLGWKRIAVSAAFNFINSCPNLTSLEFYCCCELVTVLENISNLGQIEYLIHQNCNYDILKILAQQCTQLRSYVYRGRLVDSNLEHLHIQLFLNNPMLTVIETSNILSLAMIKECCPNIEVVRVFIDRIDIIELHALLAIIKLFDVTLKDFSKQIGYDKETNHLKLTNHVEDTYDFEQIWIGIINVKIIELTNVELSEEVVDHLSSSLEILWLDNNRVVTLQLLLSKCKLLHTVHLEVAYSCDIPDLVALFHNIQPVAIRDLHLSCFSLTAGECMTIVKSCSGLQQFVVKFVNIISSDIIQAYRAELHNYELPVAVSVARHSKTVLNVKIVRGTDNDIVADVN